MEDNHSVCSGGSQVSVSLSKVECPHCNNEFQQRAIFNHIRIKHTKEMISMTSKKFLEEAIKGNPLCVYWTIKNDFDEEEEEKIYVCLSTNKTFKTDERGMLHFKKSPNDKKKHIQEAKSLLKEIIKEKKKKVVQNPIYVKEQEAVKRNDPELCRAIWRGILYHQNLSHIGFWFAEKQQWQEETICFQYEKKTRDYFTTTYSALKEEMRKYDEIIETLKDNKVLEVRVLQNLYFDLWNFWDRTLRTSMAGCPDYDSHSSGVIIPVSEMTEEFYYYANKKMVGVDF